MRLSLLLSLVLLSDWMNNAVVRLISRNFTTELRLQAYCCIIKKTAVDKMVLQQAWFVDCEGCS